MLLLNLQSNIWLTQITFLLSHFMGDSHFMAYQMCAVCIKTESVIELYFLDTWFKGALPGQLTHHRSLNQPVKTDVQ